MNITVYLGSFPGNDPILREKVIELGNWIGSNDTIWSMAVRRMA